MEANTTGMASFAPCRHCHRLTLARAVAMRECQVAEVDALSAERERHRREDH
ncbi:hypothetical protein [Streptomyces sp. UNOC14_S4]|uniref:hypothetical protein n=1 Tax=Streptomyces sp. UNOC14_S4 TaxID=2872340 RepID=UPI001E60FB27|nr:hypothetical protein [Streptomyces sp. UNOC14_S4]MCC3766882.1 hypothetical protein [Streptomyces sp. UNOC14_S4]